MATFGDICLQIDRSSVTENQQIRASLEKQLREEKEAEIAQLQEQMRQLATEKERQQQSKEREMAELRRHVSRTRLCSRENIQVKVDSVTGRALRVYPVPGTQGLSLT